MNAMGRHSSTADLRRALTAAWIVTVTMGTTTMVFQVYHSVTRGHLPWPLAGLYGIIPLALAMGVLKIISNWKAAGWQAKTVAFAIMIGSMFLSASATGEVILYAAPPHASLLFGAILDAAELLAAYFIMSGCTAAQAHGAAENEAALRAARDAAFAEARAANEAETGALRAALETAGTARQDAEQRAARAEAQAGALRRKRAPQGHRKPAANADRKTTRTRVPNDVDARAEALRILAGEPGITGKELGLRLGMSERWGQARKREYAGHVPDPAVSSREV